MSDYKYKVVVVLDDKKIDSDDYDLNDTYNIVRGEFEDESLIDVSQNDRELIFINKPASEEKAYCAIGTIGNNIYDSWLNPYVISINWYTKPSDGSEETVEEIMSEIREYDNMYK